MKILLSPFSPIIITDEATELNKKELLENLKFYLESEKSGEWKLESALLRWDIGYVLLFLKEINREKFKYLLSLISDSKLRKEPVYQKFGVPLLDALLRKFEENHIILFVENMEELWNVGKMVNKKVSKRSLILDLYKTGMHYKVKAPNVNRIWTEHNKLYPLYLREGMGSELIGYACKPSESKYLYLIKLPQKFLRDYQLIKSIILELREFWNGGVFSLPESISDLDVKTVLRGDEIKVSTEANFELCDESGKVLKPYSLLIDKFYPNEEVVDLIEKEIGVSDYCSVCRVKTDFINISNSSSMVNNLEMLLKKLTEAFKENYKVDFIGKKSPLDFSVTFDFGENFKMLHPLVKIYVKYSIEFLVQVFLYRYLYALNSNVRRNYLYVSGWNTESTKLLDTGIKCNLLPSTVVLEEFYKEVLAVMTDVVKKYFSGEIIEVDLNNYFDVDKNYYPPQFFEKLKKIKAVIEKNVNEFYDLVSLSLGDKIPKNNIEVIEEFGKLIETINSSYLENAYITFYPDQTLNTEIKMIENDFYDSLNERRIKIYQVVIPECLMVFMVAGSEKAWEEIIQSIINIMESANLENRLKENLENIKEKLNLSLFEYLS